MKDKININRCSEEKFDYTLCEIETFVRKYNKKPTNKNECIQKMKDCLKESKELADKYGDDFFSIVEMTVALTGSKDGK